MNILKTIMRVFNKRNHVKDYWKNLRFDSDHHSIDKYIKYSAKEEIFLDYVLKNIDKEKSIFEFGCNAGRCLRYLFHNGYRKLSGFDINQRSIEILIENNLEMAQSGLFISGELHEVEKNFQKFDVSLSKGVLFNVSYNDIESAIEHLCKAETVIIFEGIDQGNFIHDYHSLFSKFGFASVSEDYYPASNSNIWQNVETSVKYARKKPIYNENKLLGVFKRRSD